MDIFLNHLIQFYSNNMTNLRHLTSHSRPHAVLAHNIESRDHRLLWRHFTLCILNDRLVNVAEVSYREMKEINVWNKLEIVSNNQSLQNRQDVYKFSQTYSS